MPLIPNKDLLLILDLQSSTISYSGDPEIKVMNNLLKFFKISLLTLSKPTKAAIELEKIKNRKWFGIGAFFIIALLYTLTTIICWLQNVSVSWSPILPINPNEIERNPIPAINKLELLFLRP